MAASTDTNNKACFHSLPLELRHHIFTYIYPPWHFEYTQEHDRIPTNGPRDILSAVSALAVDYQTTPRFSNLPSLAPLLVSKAFHEAGKDILISSFTRHVHVVSRMVWREIHWTYESLLAKATDLAIDDNHFWSFRDLKILRKMVSLERLTIVISTSVARSNVRLRLLHNDDVGRDELVGDVSLEGTEIRELLPVNLDFSDKSLRPLWKGLVAGPASDMVLGMQTDPRMRMEMLSHDLETDRKIKTIWKCIMKLPVPKDDPYSGFYFFLILDYQYDFPETGLVRFTGDREPLIVRKRLVKRKWDEVLSF